MLQVDQTSVINSFFLLIERCKICEIYRGICDEYGEACLSYQNFTNRVNPDLLESKKQFIEWKHTDSLVKKKKKKTVLGIVFSKKGHADGLLGH